MNAGFLSSARFAGLLGAMLLVAAGAAAATELPDGVSVAPTPAWVETVDVERLAPAAPSDGVAYVLVDDQMSILADEPQEYRRLVYDVVERDGLEDAGRTPVSFQPDYQRVVLHGLVVVRDGRATDRLGEVRAELLRRERNSDAGVLDGERTLEMFVPDVRVGDRLDVSYSVVGANPVFGGDYHATRSTGYSQGAGMRRILVVAPASRPLFAALSGDGYTRDEQVADGVRRLAFVAAPLAAVVSEAGAPAWFDGYGHVDISTSPDWRAVADWAARLFVSDEADRRAIAGVAADLALREADPRRALTEALAFVQREVRYVSLSLGAASHRPAQPAQTLARRYGDCKDKSLLLAGLLREAGVEAEPVLVHSDLRGHVADHLPTPLAFDHAIVRARIDGEWIYVDPTRAVERGAFAEREPIPFGVGLPVADGSAALATIPRRDPDQPSIEVEQDVRIAEGGDASDADRPERAEIRVLTRYRHGAADATRARFRNDGPEQVGRDYLGFMEGMYTDIRQVAPPTIEEGDRDSVVHVEERYLAPFEPDEDAPDAVGNLDLRLFQIADWVPAARESERRWPLGLEGPARGSQVIRMRAPGGWSVPPEHETVENEWFRFDRRISVDGEILTVSGEWRRHRDAIAAADYARVRADLREVRDLLVFPVLIGGGSDAAAITMDSGSLAWPMAAMLGATLLLAGLWPVRRTHPVAGVLFAPRATTERLLGERGIPSAIALLVAAGLAGSAIEVVPALVAGESPDWGRQLLEALLAVPQQLLFAWVLVRMFRVLEVHTTVRRLFVAAAWAGWPVLVLVPLALLAAGPAVVLFADSGTWPDGPTAVVVATIAATGLLLVAAIAWFVVATVAAAAAAANARISTTLGAMVLSAAAIFVVVFVVAGALFAVGAFSLS